MSNERIYLKVLILAHVIVLLTSNNLLNSSDDCQINTINNNIDSINRNTRLDQMHESQVNCIFAILLAYYIHPQYYL